MKKKKMDDVVEAKFGQNSALFSLINYGFQYHGLRSDAFC